MGIWWHSWSFWKALGELDLIEFISQSWELSCGRYWFLSGFCCWKFKQIAKIGFTLTPTAHTTLVFVEVWRCTNYANGSHTDFQTGKKSGVGFNHVSPASCQWVSLKTKKKNKKRKQTKEKNRTITTHRTFWTEQDDLFEAKLGFERFHTWD
jgi:hypothetical protein